MVIIHADSNHPDLLKMLANAGHRNIEAYDQTREEIMQSSIAFEGLVIRSRFKIDKVFLDAVPNLKFIARVGAGLENIDVTYAESKGISLFSAPEGNRNAVGEHALGMLLSLFNKLNKADRQVREGLWYREANRGTELDGKTVGIIGYGNTGKAFARKLKGFDVKVIFYDIKENVADDNATAVSMEELKDRSDVVSLHVPQSESTDRMIDHSFIDDFSKPFWLINTARGKCVVTKDLVKGLQQGKILGAALDVLEYEKSSFEHLFSDGENLPEDLQELLLMQNVIFSPHVAGWTVESHIKLATTIAEKIIGKFNPVQKAVQPKKRVTGIGGVFFKTKDPDNVKKWYRDHLGLNTDQWGCTFWWRDENGNKCSTQWSPFTEDTSYFEPSRKDFMMNFRVENLKDLLEKLRSEGVEVMDKIEEVEEGKFGWIIDLEGNKIELWEPNDKAFLSS